MRGLSIETRIGLTIDEYEHLDFDNLNSHEIETIENGEGILKKLLKNKDYELDDDEKDTLAMCSQIVEDYRDD